MTMLHPHVSEALNRIIELFKTGDVPQAISYATFPPFDVPSNVWSLPNRIIMILNGTSDARGFRQWNEVNRYVKKGSKAFYILAPWLVRNKEKENPNEPTDIKTFLKGFLAVPVFKVEDTKGEELEYEKIELPDIPLLNVAQLWNIDVAPVAFQGGWYGYYTTKNEKIRLATPEEKTFFHELSHAAHKRVKGNLENGQNWKQEIVAELSAQTLCHIFSKNPGATIGNSYDYIAYYAEKVNKNVAYVCISVLSDVEKVLELIINTSALLAIR